MPHMIQVCINFHSRIQVRMTLVELQKRLRMLELLCEINTHFLRAIFEAIRRDICTDLSNKVCLLSSYMYVVYVGIFVHVRWSASDRRTHTFCT